MATRAALTCGIKGGSDAGGTDEVVLCRPVQSCERQQRSCYRNGGLVYATGTAVRTREPISIRTTCKAPGQKTDWRATMDCAFPHGDCRWCRLRGLVSVGILPRRKLSFAPLLERFGQDAFEDRW